MWIALWYLETDVKWDFFMTDKCIPKFKIFPNYLFFGHFMWKKKKTFKIKLIKAVLFEIMPFAATWVQLETVILTEVSQKQKDEYHMISPLSKIWHKWTNLQSRNRLTDIEDKLVSASGERGERDREYGVSRCKLLRTGWISSKVLPYSTGN